MWKFLFRDFNFLLVQYGIAVNYVGMASDAKWATSGYNNVQANPLYIPRSGYFAGSSFNLQAAAGRLWSGTARSDTGAYYLLYTSSIVYPDHYGSRSYGFPVRCIARNLKAQFTFSPIFTLAIIRPPIFLHNFSKHFTNPRRFLEF